MGNNITNNGCGLYLYGSLSNSIIGNSITNNVDGIYLYGSSNNCIIGNVFVANGLVVNDSYMNVVEGNTVNGRPLVYLEGVSNYTVADAGQVILFKCKNIRVENLNLSAASIGVQLLETNNTIIMGNSITNNEYGIRLFNSFNTIIIGNSITNNWYGILLEGSSSNSIYHNNFINNMIQARAVDEYANFWDDGYPSGGNYWSEYAGADLYSGPYQNETGSDGIGDTPYVINANNVDHYPLMTPYTPPTYTLTIIATAGGTTSPAPGTYTYTANSMVEVTAIPYANYKFDYWELDGANVGSANPYAVLMDNDHTLKAVFSAIPPLTVSINPLSASILIGQSVTFTSTVSGGYPPYSYQWYLNGNRVSGATSNTWTFTPTTSGIFYVYLNVTDGKGNTAQSETAQITATLLGDLNSDNIVDMRDIAIVAQAFGETPEQPRWNPQADINKDDKIDIRDIAIVAKNFGKKYP